LINSFRVIIVVWGSFFLESGIFFLWFLFHNSQCLCIILQFSAFTVKLFIIIKNRTNISVPKSFYCVVVCRYSDIKTNRNWLLYVYVYVLNTFFMRLGSKVPRGNSEFSIKCVVWKKIYFSLWVEVVIRLPWVLLYNR